MRGTYSRRLRDESREMKCQSESTKEKKKATQLKLKGLLHYIRIIWRTLARGRKIKPHEKLVMYVESWRKEQNQSNQM